MVTVKLQAVDQATLQMFETPQFLQSFSIDSAEFPSPRSFHGVKICSVVTFLTFYCSLMTCPSII